MEVTRTYVTKKKKEREAVVQKIPLRVNNKHQRRDKKGARAQ